MKNLLKKLGVMTASLMLMMTTFAMPSFAAAGDAEVTGVEADSSVKAYQFIEQDENNKWVPMDWVGATNKKPGEEFTVTDPYDNTKTAKFDVTATTYNKEALAIIANIIRSKAEKPSAVTFQPSGEKYTGKLANKGAYLVLVEPPAGKTTVYMPAVISRDFKTDNPSLEMKANIKKSTPEPDKNIITKEDANNKNYGSGHVGGNGNVDTDSSKKGDTLKPGDITQFEVSSPVPAYSQDYFFTKDNKDIYPVFRVNDTLNKLTLKVDNDYKFEVMSVDANGTKIKDVSFVLVESGVETNKTDGSTLNGGKNFCIRITDKAFLKEGGNLSVRYWATLDEDANVGFIPNTNTVKVEYSTKPGQESGFTEKDIITYHYTFDIDGNINGKDEGREFIKVGAIDGKIVISEKAIKSEKPLAGAVFELKQGNKVIAVAESAADGRLKAIATSSKNYNKYKTDIENKSIKNGLTKLDAGDYQLVETVAPDGYALNSNPVNVKIQATIDETTGKLTAYSVTMNDADTNTYTWNNTSNTFDTTYKYKDAEGNIKGTNDPAVAEASWSTQFENSDVGTLPSTGGMGTILFTIGGIVLIGLAFLLLFGGKRRKTQNN